MIGIKQLADLVKTQKLVENLSERELTNPEGAGFDLRVGEIYEIVGEGFLGVKERQTPELKLVAQVEKDKDFVLKPGRYYVFKTIEQVNLPEDIVAWSYSRSTLYRSGIIIKGGQINPGYQGGLSMGIVNLSSKPFRLELGARVVHVVFSRVEGGGSAYRGQWQGGRVFTRQKEKQV